MVGSWTCERGQEVQVPIPRRKVTRIFAWRACRPPTCHATHSPAFPRCINNFITNQLSFFEECLSDRSASLLLPAFLSSARQFQPAKNWLINLKRHALLRKQNTQVARTQTRAQFRCQSVQSSYLLCQFFIPSLFLLSVFIVLSLESCGRILQLERVACSSIVEREERVAFEVCWLRECIYFFHFFFLFFLYIFIFPLEVQSCTSKYMQFGGPFAKRVIL